MCWSAPLPLPPSSSGRGNQQTGQDRRPFLHRPQAPPGELHSCPPVERSTIVADDYMYFGKAPQHTRSSRLSLLQDTIAGALDACSLTFFSIRWSHRFFCRQLTGREYDAFVAEFIEAAVDKYGKSVMLQVCLLLPWDIGCMQNAEAQAKVRCLRGFKEHRTWCLSDSARCCWGWRLASVGSGALGKRSSMRGLGNQIVFSSSSLIVRLAGNQRAPPLVHSASCSPYWTRK